MVWCIRACLTLRPCKINPLRPRLLRVISGFRVYVNPDLYNSDWAWRSPHSWQHVNIWLVLHLIYTSRYLFGYHMTHTVMVRCKSTRPPPTHTTNKETEIYAPFPQCTFRSPTIARTSPSIGQSGKVRSVDTTNVVIDAPCLAVLLL